MSLDYWRNEDKTATLSLLGDRNYYIQIGEDELSGDVMGARVTEQDLRNLGKSISFLLNGA